jgi:two-component system OmpR family sensor kinase
MRFPASPARRTRRVSSTWNRLPLRLRLVAGFAAAMLLVLTAAGAFVYLRVQYALDLRLNEDLQAQSTQLVDAVISRTAPAMPPGALYQLLDVRNRVVAASSGLTGDPLLRPDQAATAQRQPVREDRGDLFPITSGTLRLYAVPLHAGTVPPAGTPAVAVVAVRRDQRNEALRELIGQLVLANLAALAVASLVGYRLARAALTPVERYRTEAARIAAGATGVRLAVPPDSHDEIARLGHTLNTMLAALETALDRERRFVNDASHELRTPLTLLNTELELALRRPRTAAELEQTLKAVAADTADLIRLADILLDVGVQPDQTHAPTLDLGDLLTNLADRYRTTSTTAATAATTLRTRLGPALLVRGDATRLEQVATNLLDNAFRHGAPPITMAADRVRDLIRVSVHDTGRGIDPTFLTRATERFSRADAARTSPGTGLGLSLVDAIVNAHHGELRICSAGAHHRAHHRFDLACDHLSDGATITVLLPAAHHGDDPTNGEDL